MSYTVAKLEVSPVAFDEIKKKLLDAGYEQAVKRGGTLIDMTGIALEPEPPHPKVKDKIPCVLYFNTEKEVEDFLEMVKSAHPNLREHKLR